MRVRIVRAIGFHKMYENYQQQAYNRRLLREAWVRRKKEKKEEEEELSFYSVKEVKESLQVSEESSWEAPEMEIVEKGAPRRGLWRRQTTNVF